MQLLRVSPLTAEAFAPVGQVIQSVGREPDAGDPLSVEHFHHLANLQFNTQPSLNILRVQPCELPLEIQQLECIDSSRSIIPLDGAGFLFAVAPAGVFDSQQLRVFHVRSWQGVNCAPGVWHSPIWAWGRVGEFLTLHAHPQHSTRGGQVLSTPYVVTRV